MQRLDHAMIFVTMASTYTALWVLGLDGRLADFVLVYSWAGAFAGGLLKVAWIDAPRWMGATGYTGFGMGGLLVLPQLIHTIGIVTSGTLLGSCVLFLAGGVLYVLQRPNPIPHVFGYHEIFHLITLVGIAMQFVAFAHAVLPH
jgi:hemolysin III